MKKIILFILSIVVSMNSCKKATETIANKATEIKDRIIDAYWSDIKELTVKVEGKEGYVVDFGKSNLGTNQSIFNTSTPFFKNITKTATNTWTADVVKGTFYFNKLTAVDYVPTTIKITTGSNGSDQITLTNYDPNFSIMYIKPSGYNPPIDPYQDQPKFCDSTSAENISGNFASLKNYWRGDEDFTNFSVRTRLINAWNPYNPCYYSFTAILKPSNGMGIEVPILLVLGHKPVASETFTFITSEYGFNLEQNQAAIRFEYSNDVSEDNVYTVSVNVSGGKITANINNILLKHKSGSVSDMTASFTLVGN